MLLHIFSPVNAGNRITPKRIRASVLSLARRTGVLDGRPVEPQLFPKGTRRYEWLQAWRRWREKDVPLLVVIGCGRSGTTYLAALFEQLGVTSGHEEFALGIRQRMLASWPLAGSGSAVPWGPDLAHIAHRKLIFVHQTRHPLDVVSSLETFNPRSWNYIAKHIDCDAERPLRRGMQYWLDWNRLAQKRARFSYQLEQIDDMLPRLLREAELSIPAAAVAHALGATSRKTNARTHRSCSWADLDSEDAGLAAEIRDLARQFGYSVEP